MVNDGVSANGATDPNGVATKSTDASGTMVSPGALNGSNDPQNSSLNPKIAGTNAPLANPLPQRGMKDGLDYQKPLYLTRPMAAEVGRRLFNDPKLSALNQRSCATCHTDRRTQAPDLAKSPPWPHAVEAQGGVLTLDQMIQICLVKQMGLGSLPWDHNFIAALASHLESIAGR